MVDLVVYVFFAFNLVAMTEIKVSIVQSHGRDCIFRDFMIDYSDLHET